MNNYFAKALNTLRTVDPEDSSETARNIRAHARVQAMIGTAMATEPSHPLVAEAIELVEQAEQSKSKTARGLRAHARVLLMIVIGEGSLTNQRCPAASTQTAARQDL